jgi:DNA-binding PadR family transcriptional regulator
MVVQVLLVREPHHGTPGRDLLELEPEMTVEGHGGVHAVAQCVEVHAREYTYDLGMALRHVLLGLLADRPDHAYALKHRLSPGLPREQLVNDGVLYPLLAKLEAEGLVTSEERIGSTGRARRVYSVRRRGQEEFRRWLHSDEDEEGPPMHELFVAHPLVKLLFAAHLSRDELRAKLDRHAERVSNRIAALDSLRAVAPTGAAAGLGPSLFELELRQLRDRLDWLHTERTRI